MWRSLRWRYVTTTLDRSSIHVRSMTHKAVVDTTWNVLHYFNKLGEIRCFLVVYGLRKISLQ